MRSHGAGLNYWQSHPRPNLSRWGIDVDTVALSKRAMKMLCVLRLLAEIEWKPRRRHGAAYEGRSIVSWYCQGSRHKAYRVSLTCIPLSWPIEKAVESSRIHTNNLIEVQILPNLNFIFLNCYSQSSTVFETMWPNPLSVQNKPKFLMFHDTRSTFFETQLRVVELLSIALKNEY